jgi:hypothetical protein
MSLYFEQPIVKALLIVISNDNAWETTVKSPVHAEMQIMQDAGYPKSNS